MKFFSKQFKEGTYKEAEIKIAVKHPTIWFTKAWCPNFKHIAICARWKDKLYWITLYHK